MRLSKNLRHEHFIDAILAASISVICRCLLRCFDSGVRYTVLPELLSAPHSPQ
jgi:hypothetical protein